MISKLKDKIKECIKMLDDNTVYSDYSGELIWIKCSLKTILMLLEDRNAR